MLPVQIQTSDGAFVTGLTRDNFIVYENDVVQPVTYFAVDDTPILYGVVAMDWGAVKQNMRDALDAMDKEPGTRVEYIQPPDPFTWQLAAERGLARLREFPNPRKFLELLGAPYETQGLPDPRDVTIVRTGEGFFSTFHRSAPPPSSYLLGYNSQQPLPTGKYAHIKVHVDQPGLSVRFRRGYFAGSGGACGDWTRQAFALPSTAVCY